MHALPLQNPLMLSSCVASLHLLSFSTAADTTNEQKSFCPALCKDLHQPLKTSVKKGKIWYPYPENSPGIAGAPTTMMTSGMKNAKSAQAKKTTRTGSDVITRSIPSVMSHLNPQMGNDAFNDCLSFLSSLLSLTFPQRVRKITTRMSSSYIGAIDQGTTSTRFLIFDQDGNLITWHQLEFKQLYPRPG